MWIQLWINGQYKGTHKVSGLPFIRRCLDWAARYKYDVQFVDENGQIIR